MLSPKKTDVHATRITLIKRVQDQYDDHAWKEFSEIYSRYIYAIIRNLNIAPHDAEEIHQQILVKLWKHLPKIDLDTIKRFRSYLGTTTKNEVLQFIRSQSRRIEREAKAGDDRSLDYLNSIRVADTEQIAEDEWRIHLTNLAMTRIAAKFSPKAIEVFQLSIDGMEQPAIAKQTGLTLNTVRNFKSRVRGHFIAELEQLKETLE